MPKVLLPKYLVDYAEKHLLMKHTINQLIRELYHFAILTQFEEEKVGEGAGET